MTARREAGSAFEDVARTLRRRAGILLLCATLGPASALAFSLTREEKYTASASLLFRDPGFDQKLFGSSFSEPPKDPVREAATNTKLVSLDVVARRTASRLPQAGSIKDKVKVEPQGQADVVAVKATVRSPRAAARIANTFAGEYIAIRREADRGTMRDA